MSPVRFLGVVGAALLCAVAGAACLHAQPSPVTLQIRPRAGDTLRLRMDQTVEMAGTTRSGEIDVTNSEMHTMVVLTRIAVEGTDLEGATVTALTDTVRLTSTNGSVGGSLLGWAKAMQGQRFQFRVALDGTTSLVGANAGTTSQVGTFLAQLPASLPKEQILPGASWNRSMEIPMSVMSDARGTATMTATFHFDSLTQGGDLAFLSVRGRLTRQSAPGKGSGAPTVEMNGTMSGTILVDRRRGWITDARSEISVRSLLTPSKADQSPIRVKLKITQWMRAQ
ncbi:MAG: DUF6263 family protein [Gemmatimonadaceae bacterium]